MKMMKHIQTWVLITLLALSANGVVNAKLASGHQNLSGNLHQSQTVLNALLHQGLSGVSTTNTSGPPLATKGINTKVIKPLQKLPDNAILNKEQISQLNKNIDAVLEKSLPVKVARGRGQDVVDLIKNDKRFRFLDQVPGGRDKIQKALKDNGLSLD